MVTNKEPASNLPLNCNLNLIYVLSFIIAILMAAASIASLLYKTIIYTIHPLCEWCSVRQQLTHWQLSERAAIKFDNFAFA